MINALTIDVEDYYSVFMRDRLDIDRTPTDAVVRNTRRVLDLLGESGVKGTFFILGEVAAAFPDLIRQIAAGGHEIGVHGYYHHQLFKLSPEQFRRECSDTRKLLEDAAGSRVAGHRAPAFSIGPETAWGLEILAEMGFQYDSSVFPFKGKRYGWGGFPRDIHRMHLPSGATIIEAPMSTVSLLGKTIPACGGGYLRHLPLWFSRWAMRRVQTQRPAIVYMHPYELDLQAPPEEFATALAKAPEPVRKFHRVQLRKRETVEHKLRSLLGSFQFAPLRDVIAQVMPDSRELVNP